MQKKYKVNHTTPDSYGEYFFFFKKEAIKFGRAIIRETLYDGDDGVFAVYKLGGKEETPVFLQHAHKRNDKVTFTSAQTSF